MATSLVTETVSIWQILLNAGLCSKLQDMCIASPRHTLRLVNKELAVLLLQHLTGALLWMPSTERVPSNSTSAALSRPQELAEFHAKLRGKSGPTALWVLSSGSNTAGPSWGNTFGPVASPRPHASPSDTAPTSSSSPWQRLTQPAHIQQGRGNSSRLWSSQEAAISSCNFLARYLAHAANYMRLGSIVSLHLDFGGGGGVQGGVELQPAHLALLTQALRHSLRHLSVTTSGADPPTGALSHALTCIPHLQFHSRAVWLLGSGMAPALTAHDCAQLTLQYMGKHQVQACIAHDSQVVLSHCSPHCNTPLHSTCYDAICHSHKKMP